MLDFDPSRPPVAPLDAATLILVRAGHAPGGLEVFFVRRHASAPFLGGAVVFPGGKVDPSDHLAPANNGACERASRVSGFAVDPGHALALAVCACRESLEEAGLLPLAGPPRLESLNGLRRSLADGVPFADAHAASGVPELDTRSLRPFARWVTPLAESRRYDARFFLAPAPEGQIPEADHHEAVAAVWAPPARMIDAYVRGDVFLAPPTLRTLELLTSVATVDAAVGLADTQSLQPIRPHYVPGEPPVIALPGDPLHDDPDRRVAGSTRFVMRSGRFVSESP